MAAVADKDGEAAAATAARAATVARPEAPGDTKSDCSTGRRARVSPGDAGGGMASAASRCWGEGAAFAGFSGRAALVEALIEEEGPNDAGAGDSGGRGDCGTGLNKPLLNTLRGRVVMALFGERSIILSRIVRRSIGRGTVRAYWRLNDSPSSPYLTMARAHQGHV